MLTHQNKLKKFGWHMARSVAFIGLLNYCMCLGLSMLVLFILQCISLELFFDI